MKLSNILPTCEPDLLDKIRGSLAVFETLPRDKKIRVSFSGGKDSHCLVALYLLYLHLGGEKLDLEIIFADTRLEHHSIYFSVEKCRTFCEESEVPFVIKKSKKTFWYILFIRGYPVPDWKMRWCTSIMKVDPIGKSKKRIVLTGRHFGESVDRDNRLKTCGTDTCGADKMKNSIDPIIDWSNCNVWDFIFACDGLFLPKGCFSYLATQYEVAEDKKTKSLRMGCLMCPVIGISSTENNVKNGIISQDLANVYYFLREMRKNARRIISPKGKLGSIYIEDRRKYWNRLDKQVLLDNKLITQEEVDEITTLLESSDFHYPRTYPREWIIEQHSLFNNRNHHF